ncbi:aegerolysin type hemolysin [Panaeolus papilionaceus]|nr:aegerolysin type hemolysin [Panaeolus papilionaceus]
MGEGDWVHLAINNKSRSRTFKISYLDAKYGKFYEGSASNEVQPAAYVNRTIAPKATFDISSCGRGDSPTGTEGNITIVDAGTGDEVANVYWDCPYSGSNKFHKTRENSEDYMVGLSNFSTSGALKKVEIDLAFLA